MNDKPPSITEELEHLFKKTTEANKVFLTESTRFIQQLGSSKLSGEQLFNLQKQLLSDAFKSFVQLNIQHASNLVDLGLQMTRQFNQSVNSSQSDKVAADDVTNNTSGPAFILNATAVPGEYASVQFLLDSSKDEPVSCTLKQNKFVLQNDTKDVTDFETSFTPQSFQLLPGKQQTVQITVHIPAGTKEGIYVSDIRVDGFEHVFFSLNITVNAIAQSEK